MKKITTIIMILLTLIAIYSLIRGWVVKRYEPNPAIKEYQVLQEEKGRLEKDLRDTYGGKG